jgi:hypothetical protein
MKLWFVVEDQFYFAVCSTRGIQRFTYVLYSTLVDCFTVEIGCVASGDASGLFRSVACVDDWAAQSRAEGWWLAARVPTDLPRQDAIANRHSVVTVQD